MFHVLAVIDIEKHVRHLDVHKGSVPSVELKCFGSSVDMDVGSDSEEK